MQSLRIECLTNARWLPEFRESNGFVCIIDLWVTRMDLQIAAVEKERECAALSEAVGAHICPCEEVLTNPLAK
jgi:hypothetical protein